MGLGTIAKGLAMGAATGLAAFSVKKLQTNDQGKHFLETSFFGQPGLLLNFERNTTSMNYT